MMTSTRLRRRVLLARIGVVALMLLRLTGIAVRARVAHRADYPDIVAGALVDGIERLGGAYIKFGQLLATRPDIVGMRISDQLARLQDSVAPMPVAEALTVLEHAPAQLPAEARAAVEAGPVASGSIACVYRCQPAEGAAIALKIRRPSAVRTVRADTAILRRFARGVSWLPPFWSSPIVTIVDQLSSAIEAQLDLSHERVMLQMLAGALVDEPDIIVPRPIEQFCGDDLLAMDFLEDLDRDGFAQAGPRQRQQGITTLVRGLYRLIFEHGFIHVDLHQGNAYLLSNGKVALLDVGFAHLLSEFARDRFTQFFGGMVNGHGHRCADIVLSTTSSAGRGRNPERFREEVIELVEESAEQDVAHFSVPKFAVRLFRIQQRNGYYADPEMTFPLLCLIALEGTVNKFAPEMDFQIEAAPYIMANLL
ncbi:ABC1 kinase family protein [Nocardia sp. NPDC060256]|uniref:ABC1 kinase family protein n=1 Tax=unclassified Nocardia TaxID=2637762 RepID=UPI00364AF34B